MLKFSRGSLLYLLGIFQNIFFENLRIVGSKIVILYTSSLRNIIFKYLHLTQLKIVRLFVIYWITM